MKGMKLNGCAPTMNNYVDGQLQCFQCNVDSSAIAQDHTISNSRRRCHKLLPPDVAEARCASRSALTAAEKMRSRKVERRLTRKWKAETILKSGFKGQTLFEDGQT